MKSLHNILRSVAVVASVSAICIPDIALRAETTEASKPTSMHVFRKGYDWPKVSSYPLKRLDSIVARSGSNPDRLLFASRDKAQYIYLDSIERYEFGHNVPTVYITTDTRVFDVTSKVDYLSGVITMHGYGAYEDFDTTEMQIRGRGNSTWFLPKKPYRVKFGKKQSLAGMKKAKNYVLIANYLDPTLMRNPLAFRMAQLMDMPWTNHAVPVNVWFNGFFKGAYMLSEKVGINAGSVDIEEETAIMWELDQSFDEDYKFYSAGYDLPVMVKDPDPADFCDEDAGETPELWLAEWQVDFENMERAVREGRAHEVIDISTAVDYFLVNNVAGNHEINWPKSTYLYKEKVDDLYSFGPVWDFDWAFGYEQPVDAPLIGRSLPGYRFMVDIMKDEEFMPLFEEKWARFRDEVFPMVLEYFDEYAATVRISALQDGEQWPTLDREDAPLAISSEQFDVKVPELRAWLIDRVAAIDADPLHLLYAELPDQPDPDEPDPDEPDPDEPDPDQPDPDQPDPDEPDPDQPDPDQPEPDESDPSDSSDSFEQPEQPDSDQSASSDFQPE